MSRSDGGTTVVYRGCGIGTILACILSWTTWHSVGWLIIHGLFGWFYVIYWMLFYWKGQ